MSESVGWLGEPNPKQQIEDRVRVGLVLGQKCVGLRIHGFLGLSGFDQRRRKPTPALENESSATATTTATATHLAFALPAHNSWQMTQKNNFLSLHFFSFCNACVVTTTTPSSLPTKWQQTQTKITVSQTLWKIIIKYFQIPLCHRIKKKKKNRKKKKTN